MNRIAVKLITLLTLLAITGCATSTIRKAKEKGYAHLTVDQIYAIANNNTLHLVASDFDAHLFLADNGKFTAKSLKNADDTGFWDIKSDARLCLKFNIWYYGDVRCYSIYQEPNKESYLLFTNNGALAYTATATSGNGQKLQLPPAKKKDEYVRESLNSGKSSTAAQKAAPPATTYSGPAASSEEINQTVKNMAKDCPDCNLEEADLRQANLVGANLKGANLKGADLSRANLRRANLEGADLSGATLLSTNLPGANLKDADLSGADLTGSNLIHADMTGADLENAILKNSLQEGAKGLR